MKNQKRKMPSLIIPDIIQVILCHPETVISCQWFFSLCVLSYRQNRRSAIKHSQSGDVSQATQRLKGRKKLQRGLSEDVPYCTRPQVRGRTLGRTLAKRLPRRWQRRHSSSHSLQESVELKQVDNISDTDEYLSLDGHGRAASLPRLNAEYYVSSL